MVFGFYFSVAVTCMSLAFIILQGKKAEDLDS